MDGLGRTAYEAYGDQRGWKVFNGDPMPTWYDQDEAIRVAWDAAADAVSAAVRKGLDIGPGSER